MFIYIIPTQRIMWISNTDSGTYYVGTGVGTTMRDQIEKIVAVFSPTYKKSTISIDRNKPNTTEYILVKQKKN